jgi:hypothetical protein
VTHGFTSLPKEGVLRIFPPLKIRRLRPGLNPRTWAPEASTNLCLLVSPEENKSKKQNKSNRFVKEEILATLKQGGNTAHASAEKLRFKALL